MTTYTRKSAATDSTEIGQIQTIPNFENKRKHLEYDLRTGKITKLVTDDAEIIAWMDATASFNKGA